MSLSAPSVPWFRVFLLCWISSWMRFPAAVAPGVYLATKSEVKKSVALRGAVAHEPDLLIFLRQPDDGGDHAIWVVELKVGHVFDTKKVAGELAALNAFLSHLGQRAASRVHGAICCFYQDDRLRIAEGLKRQVPDDQILTGRELCALLGFPSRYDELAAVPRQDGAANRRWLRDRIVAATISD